MVTGLSDPKEKAKVTAPGYYDGLAAQLDAILNKADYKSHAEFIDALNKFIIENHISDKPIAYTEQVPDFASWNIGCGEKWVSPERLVGVDAKKDADPNPTKDDSVAHEARMKLAAKIAQGIQNKDIRGNKIGNIAIQEAPKDENDKFYRAAGVKPHGAAKGNIRLAGGGEPVDLVNDPDGKKIADLAKAKGIASHEYQVLKVGGKYVVNIHLDSKMASSQEYKDRVDFLKGLVGVSPQVVVMGDSNLREVNKILERNDGSYPGCAACFGIHGAAAQDVIMQQGVKPTYQAGWDAARPAVDPAAAAPSPVPFRAGELAATMSKIALEDIKEAVIVGDVKAEDLNVDELAKTMSAEDIAKLAADVPGFKAKAPAGPVPPAKAENFKPFRLDYKPIPKPDPPVTPDKQTLYDKAVKDEAIRQAKEILARVKKELEADPSKKVGIIYSANNGQIAPIHRANADGSGISGIDDVNQAAVMREVENLLKQDENKDLKGKFQIMPIATLDDSRDPIPPGDPKWKEYLDRDLAYIDKFIAGGGVLLGWQNQDANDEKPKQKFAIGGGVAGPLPDAVNDRIQGHLLGLQGKRPAPVAALPFVMINDQKVAPFKKPDGRYGGFANTTNQYPVRQEVELDGKKVTFKWPSSEHAYHAQKLINLSNLLPKDDPQYAEKQAAILDALKQIEKTQAESGQEFLPRDHFDPIARSLISRVPALGEPTKDSDGKSLLNSKGQPITPLDAFNSNCVGGNFAKQEAFMREVIKLKLEQNRELKDLAMKMAREGIMPIEYSTKDSKWASGPDGKGGNLLGILILEEGIELLKKNKEKPHESIMAPGVVRWLYRQIQEKGVDALSHDNLAKRAGEMERPVPPKPAKPSSAISAEDKAAEEKLAKERAKLEGLAKEAAEAEKRAAELERQAADKAKLAEEAEARAAKAEATAKSKEEEVARLGQAKSEAAQKLQDVSKHKDSTDLGLEKAIGERNRFQRLSTGLEENEIKRKKMEEGVLKLKGVFEGDKANADNQKAYEEAQAAYDAFVGPDGEYGKAKKLYDDFVKGKDPVELKKELEENVSKLKSDQTEASKSEAEAKEQLSRLESQIASLQVEANTAKTEATKLRSEADGLKKPANQAAKDATDARQAAKDAAQKVEDQKKVVDKAKSPTSTPEDEAKKQAEEQKEASQKEAERQKRQQEQEAARKLQFAELYSDKINWPRDKWVNVYNSQNKDKDDPDCGVLRMAGEKKDLKFPPGTYRHPKHGNSFDIKYGEDGSVKPIPPKSYGEFNKEGYSAAMDFLAGALGASTIVISLPSTNPMMKDFNKQQLRELLALAHEKGLAVEFDKQTMAFLDTLSPKEKDRFMRAHDLLKQNQLKNEVLMGYDDKNQYNKAINDAKKPVIPGGPDEVKTLKDELDNKKDTDEKLGVLDKQLGNIDKALDAVREQNERLLAMQLAVNGLMADPKKFADYHRENVYRTKWLRFKDFIRPNVRENLKDFQNFEKGIKALEEKIEKSKSARDELISAIEAKMDKLEKLAAECKKGLDDLKSKKDPDPDKQKKIEDKIQKLEKKLAEVDEKLKNGKVEVQKLKKEEQELKQKFVEAKEAAAEQFKQKSTASPT